MAKILLVDDDLVYLDELSDGLSSLKHDVSCAASTEEAQVLLENAEFDVVICDTIMEGGGALSLLHHLAATQPDLPFIVITGRPEIASSPLFRSGMKEASAKIEKSATLFEIDQLIRSTLR